MTVSIHNRSGMIRTYPASARVAPPDRLWEAVGYGAVFEMFVGNVVVRISRDA